MADLTSSGTYFQTYDNTGTGVAVSKLGANKKADDGQGIAGKTTIVTVGVGGGAISQAQLDGIINGLSQGASLVNANAKSDAFTVVGVAGTSAGAAFNPGVSTSAILALQGTGTPNTADAGEYFAAATVAITATFPGISG